LTDIRHVLQEASNSAPGIGPDIDELFRRRNTKAHRSRISTVGVALLIAASGTTFALRAMSAPGHGIQPGAGDRSVPAADGIGAPTQDLRLGQGEYYFQRFDDGYGTCESWWALDDSGRLATVGGPSENGSCWGPMRGTYGPATFYTDSGPVAGLSTDPQQLLAQLTQRVRPGGASPEPYQDWGGPIEWGLIRSIGELLQAPDVTPEQKAALMDVAVGLSTSVDTRSADPEGRPAILLTLHSENQMHRWWFDPETHQPLVVDGFTVQAAGVTGSTDSSDLERAFVPEIQG
jgi:hypothetical protein